MHAFDRRTDRQTDRQTDGQTDRIPIAIPRLHSMQRGKITFGLFLGTLYISPLAVRMAVQNALSSLYITYHAL